MDRKLPSYFIVSIFLISSGILLLIGSLGADGFGFGSEPGTFGWKQQYVAVVGVILLLTGFGILAYKNPPKYNRDLLSSIISRIFPSREKFLVFVKKPIFIYLILVVIILLAALVRGFRSKFGLPYLYYYDEPLIASDALRMLKTGDFKPQQYYYGSILTYLSLVVDIFHYLYLMTQSPDAAYGLESLEQIEVAVDGFRWGISHPTFYLWDRLLIALMGTATVALVYYIAKEISGIWAGLLAMVLLATLQFHIDFSSVVSSNAPVAFFTVLTVAFSVLYLKEEKPIFLILALITSGVAGSIKYNAVIAVLIPMFALMISAISRSESYRSWYWVLVPVVPTITFLICIPYALLDLPKFLSDVAWTIRAYKVSGWEGQEIGKGLPNLTYQIDMIIKNVGIFAAIISLFGLFAMMLKRKAWVILVFPLAYLLFMSGTRLTFHRNYVVIYPFVAIAFGVGSIAAFNSLLRLPFENKKNQYAVSMIFILFMVGFSITQFSRVVRVNLKTTDTRTKAIQAVNQIAKSSNKEIRVGIAEEMRLHDVDLSQLTMDFQILPLEELACNLNNYDLIISAQEYDRERYANRFSTTALALLNASIPNHLESIAIDSSRPLYLNKLSQNPAIKIFAVPEFQEQTTCLDFQPEDIISDFDIINREIKIDPGTSATTKAVPLSPGSYQILYYARGNSPQDPYPHLKISLTQFTDDGREITLDEMLVQLTTDETPYLFQFDILEDIYGAFEINLVENSCRECQDHIAWVKDIRVRQLSSIAQYRANELNSGHNFLDGAIRIRSKKPTTTAVTYYPPGTYEVHWDARGVFSEGDPTIMEVRLFQYEPSGILKQIAMNSFELNKIMETYTFPIEITEGVFGIIQFTSNSDLELGREVWLGPVTIQGEQWSEHQLTKEKKAIIDQIIKNLILDLEIKDIQSDGKFKYIIASTGQKAISTDDGWVIPESLPSTERGTVRVIVRPPINQNWNDQSHNIKIVNEWGQDQRFYLRKHFFEDESDEPILQYVIRNATNTFLRVQFPLGDDFDHNEYLDLALAWNGENAYAYLNGELVGSSSQLELTGDWDITDLYVGGDILYVGTYDQALTAEEMRILVNFDKQ